MKHGNTRQRSKINTPVNTHYANESCSCIERNLESEPC